MSISASELNEEPEVVHAPLLDKRYCPPVLPPAVCWSAVTEPEFYERYITTEGLTACSLDEPSTISTRRDAPLESSDNKYPDEKSVRPANSKMDNLIRCNYDSAWIYMYLFADDKLPVPFDYGCLWSDKTLWDSTQGNFANLPDFSDAAKTAEWFNYLSKRLGILYGLVPRDSSSDSMQQTVGDEKRGDEKREKEKCEDTLFIYEKSNEDFSEGQPPKKYSIYVVDRSLQQSTLAEVSLQWPLVKAIIAIAYHDKPAQSELIQMIMDGATNMFNSQLQRRFVVGLAIWGQGTSMHLSIMIVDRAGVTSTMARRMVCYGAASIGRVVCAMTYGDNQLLGVDPKVITNPITGHPQAVIVDNQQFTIISKIFASPHLFGRGTQVYIVKDQYGQFHVLKDSWADASHKFSEIDCIKNISSKVQSEDLNERSKILSPRFVAGEDHINHTNEPRHMMGSDGGRIRRRVVTGPIGDPITTYRSRVECLRVLLDVVDRLEFFHNKCDIVHSDISIDNIVIVRFLPAIISALKSEFSASLTGTEVTANAAAPCQLATDGNEAGYMPSSLENVSITTVDASSQPPEAKTFLPSSPESGGSVMDFDCSGATNTVSTGPIGTLPYMSVELTEPKKSCVRELRHDLESVFLVLLHLARFTCGPPGASVGEVKVSHRITQWHHESDIDILKDKKQMDILNIHKSPAEYLTEYWAPIAPYIQELIKAVYGTGDLLAREVKSQATVETFKAVLVRALEHCQTLSEIPVSYPPIQPPPVARPNLKRARPESWAATDDDRAGSRSPEVFCSYQSSVSDEMHLE